MPQSHWSSSPEMQTLRVALSTLGVAVSSVALMCSFAHGNELVPTIIRYTISWQLYLGQNRPVPVNQDLQWEEN